MAVARTPCQGGLPKSREIRYLPPMSKGDEERERRLAEALRENLRRRKAQARDGSREESAPPEHGGDAYRPDRRR